MKPSRNPFCVLKSTSLPVNSTAQIGGICNCVSTSRTSLPLVSLLSFSAVTLFATSSYGQTLRTWDGGSSTAWNTSANWAGQGAQADRSPDTAGEVAEFANATTRDPASYATAITIGGFSLTGGEARSLTFTNTIALGQYGVDNSSAFALSITGGGTTTLTAAQAWTVSGTGNTVFGKTIANAGFLLTLDGSTTGTGTITSDISGPGGITKSGSGTWTLSGSNTHTGVTTINGGVLSVGAIGNGGVAGNLGQATNAAANLIIGNGTLQYTGATASTDRAYTITAGQTATFDITANNLTISGASAATTGALTKIGAGALTLSGANSYSGTTTIQAGSLVVGAAAPSGSGGALGNATSAVILGDASTAAGGAPSLLINGAFTVARAITVGSVTNTAAYNAVIGGSNTAGTSTYSGSITLNNTATNYTTTLQAATGGTVDFIGAWTTNNRAINIGSAGNTGTVKLTNTLATTGGVNVNFGTFLLGASDRLDNVTPVTVAGGTLDTASFSDVVSVFNMSSGSLNGSGTITAANYGLSGGTVNANLGAGTMTVTSGTSNLVGLSGATAVNLNSGSLALGASNRLADSAVVTANGGSLSIGNFNDTVGSVSLTSGSITGTGGTLTGSSYAVQSGSISAILGGSGIALTKSGAGTVTLSAANTYTGDTIIKAGTLKLDGSGNVASTNIIVGDTGSSGAVLDATTKTGGFIVASGRTVGGVGSINGSTTIQSGGTLAPGNSAGILNLGNIDLQANSSFNIELGGTAVGTGYDQLNVTGSATLAGLLNVTMLSSFVPNNGDLFFLIANDGVDAIAGKFSNANVNDATVVNLGGRDWLISYTANFEGTPTFTGGNDVALMAVPEPNAALIGGVGVLLLLRRRRA